MPDEFILNYVSFDDENRPFIDAEKGGELSRLPILGEKLAYEFDLSEKFCVGWVDFEKRRGVPCPDSALVDAKYESCIKCRNRTGFNPAFYNATSVSEQQEKINQQPHFVYLAYFAPSVIKVGISQEARGTRRILEQGARMAMKLETFGSALVARQYEEKISKLPNIVDNVTGGKKIELLKQPFDSENAEKSLLDLKQQIEESLNITLKSAEIIETNNYFMTSPVEVNRAIDMTSTSKIVGEVVAAIGAIIITEYESNLLVYNLKKLIGYRAKKILGEIDIELPSEQLTLF